MNYKLETLEQSPTVYMRNVGAYGSQENFKMMVDFKNWIDKNDLKNELIASGVLGVALDNPEYTATEECRYDVILCVPNNKKYISEVKLGQFEGGKYAVFTIPHTKEAVQKFWTNLENNINQNKLNVLEKPIIERFREENGVCEFLVPIK